MSMDILKNSYCTRSKNKLVEYENSYYITGSNLNWDREEDRTVTAHDQSSMGTVLVEWGS
jgi:hypothetical protein